MVRKDFANPDPYPTHSFVSEEVVPSRSSHLGLGNSFSQCQCVGALAPLLLLLLGSGGLFCLTPVCGCACTPPTCLIGFWGIVLLRAGVWVHLHPSLLCYWVLGDCFTSCWCVGALAPLPLLCHSPPLVASPHREPQSCRSALGCKEWTGDRFVYTFFIETRFKLSRYQTC